MRIILFVLFALIINSQSLTGQIVPEQQRPLVGKVAATWCPPCGGWGWDFFESLIEENKEKATFITAHHSGNLANTIAEEFAINFGAPYQPYFYYNIEDQNVTSENANSKLEEIKEKIEADWLGDPVANTGFDLIVQEETLKVNSRTLFFEEAEGEFYLGLYFVENEVIAYQANQGNDANHEKILRSSISEGIFGEFLGQGVIQAGTEFFHSFESSLSDFNLDHLEVISIIWKKVDDIFEVVNTNISTEFTLISASDDFTDEYEFTLDVQANAGNIVLSTNRILEDSNLRILDITGNEVETLYSGHLTAGTHSISMKDLSKYPSGLYLALFESEGKMLTQKFNVH